jgi:hypothetical protein
MNGNTERGYLHGEFSRNNNYRINMIKTHQAILSAIAIIVSAVVPGAYAGTITQVGASISMDESNIEHSGFSLWTSDVDHELTKFAGTFQSDVSGYSFSSGLVVLTEHGTGTGRDAVISDILAYVISGRVPIINTRGVIGAFLSDSDSQQHTVGDLARLVGLLPTLPNWIIPNEVRVLEETGDWQSFDTGTGLTIRVVSDVEKAPDGGSTFALLGLGMVLTAGLSRKLRHA